MVEFLLLVPPAALEMMDAGGRWGHLSAHLSNPDLAGRIVAISSENGPMMPVETDRPHFLTSATPRSVGRWFRVDPETHEAWLHARIRGGALTLKGFRDRLPSYAPNPVSGMYFAITYAPDISTEAREVGVPRLAGWAVAADGAQPVAVDLDQTEIGVSALEPAWPADVLQNQRVCIIGVGSIGSASAHALASYGIGSIDLVDPDRLLRHNLIRHLCSARHVGKLKVKALHDDLEQLRPDTRTVAHPLDVIEDANAVRELFADADVVVCATDGVASRRVVGHLARRAGKDAVLACVLESGALGEVIRLRPWADRGCIVCTREHLQEAGAFDPEPGINRPYGQGTHHLPMTAVGGDLHLVGQHAAKMAVATLLQANGFNEQRTPSDHMIIGLRPAPAWPEPYNVRRCGETKWLPPTLPRPGCPTCATPPATPDTQDRFRSSCVPR
jgi:hypothetical protein